MFSLLASSCGFVVRKEKCDFQLVQQSSLECVCLAGYEPSNPVLLWIRFLCEGFLWTQCFCADQSVEPVVPSYISKKRCLLQLQGTAPSEGLLS